MAAKAKKAKEFDRLKAKVTGQETKPAYGSRRKDREEFSDNDLISDDEHEEILQDVETRPGKESNVPNTRTIHGRGALRDDNSGPTSSRVVDDKRKGDGIDEITGPRKKPPEKIPPKSFTEQIFTRVFLAQVFLCVACNLVVSCVFVFLLMSNLNKTVDEADARLKEMNDEKDKLILALSEAKALKDDYKSKLENFSQKLETIQHNVFNKDSFIIAFMILIVIVLSLTVSVYNLYQRQKNQMPWSTVLPNMNNPGDKKILKQIDERPELDPGVCIISFDEKRTTTHKRLLESANILNCKVKVHVIRRHEQIPQLPRCQVYLMCTEFSERHVIIEEPGKGLGDLHRTTYNAVMKMGGCLIILYTRDPGSRNLKDQSLYNNKIYCVTNQHELSVLEQDGRFFSVYDNLTPFQKNELQKIIMANIKVDV